MINKVSQINKFSFLFVYSICLKEFTKSQSLCPLANDSQANFYCLLLKAHAPICTEASQQAADQEGHFQKSNLCPTHRKQPVKVSKPRRPKKNFASQLQSLGVQGSRGLALTAQRRQDGTSDYSRGRFRHTQDWVWNRNREDRGVVRQWKSTGNSRLTGECCIDGIRLHWSRK